MKNTLKKIEPENKKVLFISYYFPPAGGVGRLRVVKYLKYLQDFGWKPVALTVKKHFYPLVDQSLAKEIPDNIAIHRIKYLEPAFWFNVRPWQSFLAYFIYPFFLFPDIRALWIYPAYKRARKLITEEGIKVIFTSSSSLSDHIVGYWLKKTTGVKWVADFRDEWATNAYFKFPTSFHKGLARRWEKKVLDTADQITTVSDLLADYFKTRAKDKTKIQTLTNGFDPQDFQGRIAKPSRDYCQIVYAGTLFRNQRTDTLEQALKELNLPKIKVEYYGGAKRLPHGEMVQTMRRADILLLILSSKEHPVFLIGKLFEYLAARRPILTLAPKNNLSTQIIEKLKVGEIANPDSVKEIKQAVLKLYKKWEKGELFVPENDLSQFDRKALTGRLAQIFNQLTEPKPLKVCLVVNGLSPQSKKLCQYLLKQGHQIHLVSLVNKPLNLPGIKNYWLRQELNIRWEPLKVALGAFNKIKALIELRKIIYVIKPDIVHGHGLNFAGILATFSGFHPNIASTRGSDVMQFEKMIKPEQYLIRQTLKKADLVTGNSLALRDKSLVLGMPKTKFRLVYFGVDKDIFKKKNVLALRKKLKITPAEKVIFCPRSINHIYNTDILIQAVSKLKTGFKLIFVKQNLNPEYWVKIQELIKELDLGKNIILLPKADVKDMANLYNLADVVVSLAQSDGLAASFLEAMACEKKIVISNVGFVKEWFDKRNFWVVPIGHIEATAKAIKSALDFSDRKFEVIGKRNRELVLERAEFNKGFAAMEAVYNEALAKSSTLD